MQKLMELFLDMGIKNLTKYGSVAPVAFIISDTEKTINMMDFSDIDLAIKNLRSVCRALNANKVIIMAEAYHSCDLSAVRPSMAPDREESIIIKGEDINGESCAILQPFYRDEKGNIKFKDKITQLQVSPFGRMGKIFGS